MKAELIQIKGNMYQPYNIFIDGTCVGTFKPNSSLSIDILADALGLPGKERRRARRVDISTLTEEERIELFGGDR